MDLEAVRAVRFGSVSTSFTEQQAILYNISLGCRASDLKYTFELHDKFSVLPTFGVIPAQAGLAVVELYRFLPNFNPAKLLHGEHYLELLRDQALPTSGTMVTSPQIVDMQDKGRAAVVVVGTRTVDEATQQPVAYNEFTTFVVGSGGFGNKSTSTPATRPPAALAANPPPNRPPDAVVTEKTGGDQAALYRLNGDLNPLHIDPEFSAQLGFPQPILHGLCSFGLSAKHIIQTFGDDDASCMKNIKVRFRKHVFPGETIQTRMWVEKEANKVVFETWVLERNEAVISAAAMQLQPGKLVGHARSRSKL